MNFCTGKGGITIRQRYAPSRGGKRRRSLARLSLCILLTALMLLLGSCSGIQIAGSSGDQSGASQGQTGDGEGEAASSAGIWKIGIYDLDLPPLFYRDADGELIGFEIDLISDVAARLGREIEFVRVTDQYAEALDAGEVDIVWGNIPYTEEPPEGLAMTRPYLKTKQVAVVVRDAGIETKADLDGKIVGAIAWTPAHRFALSQAFGLRYSNLGGYSRYMSAVDSLLTEPTVAILCDETLADHMMEELDEGFTVLPEALGEARYVAVLRDDDTQTHEAVQAALDAIAASGAGEVLSEQWFQKNLFIE